MINDMPFAQMIQWGAIWLSSGSDMPAKLILPNYVTNKMNSEELKKVLNG